MKLIMTQNNTGQSGLPEVNAAPVVTTQPDSHTGLSGSSSSSRPIETTSEAAARRNREQAEEDRLSLVPDKRALEAVRYGRLSTFNLRPDEVIDIGGDISLTEAGERKLGPGQKIDFDRALYDRISDTLQVLKEWERQGILDKSKLTRLQRVMLAKFETYEKRAKDIARRKSVRDKKERAKPENKLTGEERIFHSGEEIMQAIAYLQETEILAAHALGYEITNGGTKTLSYELNPKKIELLEQVSLPSQVGQALYKIVSAMGLTNSEKLNRIVLVLASLGTSSGCAALGTVIGALTGNLLLGASIGAGAGVAIFGGEIAIGSWVLSFEEPKAGKSIKFNLKFNPETPGSVKERITDNAIGKIFLGLGGRYHLNASEFIAYSEMTRHGIYSRLGLRVEQHFSSFNWQKLTLEQKAFIRSVGFDPDHPPSNTNERNLIEDMAKIGLDLWMVDLSPANLSQPGGVLDFDRRVRENIQMILARDHPELPPTAISADVSWRDFSSLSIEERHRIMMEAIDLAGVDICREKADEVLQEIAVGSEIEQGIREAEVTEIEKRAQQIESGAIVLHDSGITREKILEGRRRLAQVKDKVTALRAHGAKIAEIDTKIAEKQSSRDVAEAEYQKVLQEEGRNDSSIDNCTGKIRDYRQKINDLNNEIQSIENQMGHYDSSTRLYKPEDSAQAAFHRLDAKVKKLETAYETKEQELHKLRPDNARYSAALLQLENLNTQLTKAREQFNAAKTRLEQLQQQKAAKMQEREAEMAKIVAAEGVVKNKKDALDAINAEIELLQRNRQNAIQEIRRLTSFSGDYGQELYNTLLAEAQAEVAQLEKELKEQGIPLEGEVPPTGEGGKSVVVSREDREIAKAMHKIAAVCKADAFSAKIEGIRKRKKDELQEFADPRTSHEAVLRYIFGAEALSPTERAFYERILSKALLVEAYFVCVDLTDSRAATFFAKEPEMLNAFRLSRANVEQMNRLVKQIRDLRQLYAPGEPTLTAQIEILERQLRNLQSQNVRLLTPIYEKIAPFLGEHSLTTSEYFRVVMDRMRRNALEFNPFADAVQEAEILPPHVNPDGVVSFHPPDINPQDGSWINRGSVRWVSPAGYKIGDEDVELRVETSITASGQLGANIEVRVQTLGGILKILPNKKDKITDPLVRQELDNLGLLPHLYNNMSGDKISDINGVVDSMVKALLPSSRPNMTQATNQEVIKVKEYLRKFGFDETILGRIYNGANVGAQINTNEARNVTLEAINKKVKQVVLRLQNLGFENAASLEAWLQTGNSFSGAEVQRIFKSLARAVSENPANVNILLLGDRFNEVVEGNFTIKNINGELILFYQDNSNTTRSATLREILQLPTATRITRFSGLDDSKLDKIILNVGKNAMEAIRQRTP